MVPTVVFLIRIPGLPGLFQCYINLGRRWSRRPTRPGDRGAGLPSALPLAAQGRPCDDGLLVVEAKAEEGGVT